MSSPEPPSKPETPADVVAALRVDLAAMRRRAEDRRELDLMLSTSWLGAVLEDTDAEVRAAGRVAMSLSLQPDGIIVVQGRLSVGMEVPCGRCLDPAAVDGSADILATFLPASVAAERASTMRYADEVEGDEGEDGIALHEEDLDTWSYEGTALALDGLVAEQIKLAYPMRALCTRGEECRGLCSNCGAALNELPASVRVCPSCHCAVPATPAAADDPAPGAESGEPPREGSLAAALKKAGLDP